MISLGCKVKACQLHQQKFSFGDNYYKQTNKVAMGTKMGPSFANLFLGFIKHQLFQSLYHDPNSHYIEDCIDATSSNRKEFIQFITAVNSFHLAPKYTSEISDTSLAFLDMKVSV